MLPTGYSVENTKDGEASGIVCFTSFKPKHYPEIILI